MFKFCGIFLVVAMVLVESSEVYKSLTVAESFIENEIVPDIIDVPPQGWLDVWYPSGVSPLLGSPLTPTAVKDQPKLSWDVKPDTYYTLIFSDADAPSRADPSYRALVHWLVVNIPGDDVTNGDNLWQFFGSGPSLGSGFHRYVFLVFEQPSYLNFDEPALDNTSITNRTSISVVDFADKYNLQPAAGNFYEAQYDDYVPILQEQLGLSSS